MSRTASRNTLVATLALALVGCVGSVEPQPQSQIGYTHEELNNLPLAPSRCGAGRWKCKSRVITDANGNVAPPAGSLGATDLQSAYKLDPMLKGLTIGITDAFAYPNAESDMNQYRSNYGLPACTVASGCLTIVNQDGNTSPMPPAAPAGNDWSGETALDLDMASAACPLCKIVLVLTNSDMDDGLMIAQETAAKLGAAVISDSWGGPEDGMELSKYEAYFKTSTGAAIFVASGDAGNTGTMPDYPSTSQYAIGVGGTTLAKSTTAARGWTENAWSSGGSSCSKSIPKPSYQTDPVCAFRMAADVSGAASNILTIHNGSSVPVAGTSCASPLVAGIFAATGHGFTNAAFVYKNPTGFNDITTGTNGSCGTILCKAGTAWDGPTGVGTPIGSVLSTIPPDGHGPADMATPPDMAQAPADLSTGGGGAGGGGGGTGGGSGNGGGNSGCSMGGSSAASTGAWILAVVFAGVLGSRRRRPPRS